MTREEAINTVRNMVRNIYQTDKEKEALGILIPELAESEDERIRKELVAFFKAMQDSPWREEYWHDLEIERILAYLEKQKEQNLIMANSPQLKEQKPNIEICPHSVKSKSYKENGFPFEGLKGPSSDPGDPGRRGRMGGVPKEISKEAEAFQAKFPGPYNEDDIITAYETAKMKAIEDLPKWKAAKTCGKGECTVGSAFEATGRRYPILYCYGYGISIEQLFEKLPKKED